MAKPRQALNTTFLFAFTMALALAFFNTDLRADEKYRPQKPSELPIGTSQDIGVRTTDHFFIYINPSALAKTYPKVALQILRHGMTAAQIKQAWNHWLDVNVAYVSKAQLLLNGIRHTPIPVNLKDTVIFYRPYYSAAHRYTRSAVKEVYAPDGTPAGLVDLKGAGFDASAIESKIMPQIREYNAAGGDAKLLAKLYIQDHNDGLAAEGVAELVRQVQIQIAFDIENPVAGTDYETNEVLFLMYTGADLYRPGKNAPAIVIGRQANWGRKENLVRPSEIYTDEHGRMQHTYFDTTIDFGGTRVHYRRFADDSRALDGSDSIDPQRTKIWAWSAETTVAAVREKSDLAVVNHLRFRTEAHRQEWLNRGPPGPYSDLEKKRQGVLTALNNKDLATVATFLKSDIGEKRHFSNYLLLQISAADAPELWGHFSDDDKLAFFDSFDDLTVMNQSKLQGRMPLPPWFYPSLFRLASPALRGRILLYLSPILNSPDYPLKEMATAFAPIALDQNNAIKTRQAALDAFVKFNPENHDLLGLLMDIAMESDSYVLQDYAAKRLLNLNIPNMGPLIVKAIERASQHAKLTPFRELFAKMLGKIPVAERLNYIFQCLDAEFNRNSHVSGYLQILTDLIGDYQSEAIVQKATELYATGDRQFQTFMVLDLIQNQRSPQAIALLLKILRSTNNFGTKEQAYKILFSIHYDAISLDTLEAALNENYLSFQTLGLSVLTRPRFIPVAYRYLSDALKRASASTQNFHTQFLSAAHAVAECLQEHEQLALARQTIISDYPLAFKLWGLTLLFRTNTEETIDLYEQALQDSDAKIRVLAAKGLTYRKSPRLRALIQQALDDANLNVVLAGMAALAENTTNAWAFDLAVTKFSRIQITNRLEGAAQHWPIIRKITDLLSKPTNLDADTWALGVASIYENPDDIIKMAALRAMGQGGDAVTRNILTDTLAHSNNITLRMEASRMLATRTDQDLLTPLYALAANDLEGDVRRILVLDLSKVPNTALVEIMSSFIAKKDYAQIQPLLSVIASRNLLLNENLLLQLLNSFGEDLDQVLIFYVHRHKASLHYTAFWRQATMHENMRVRQRAQDLYKKLKQSCEGALSS